jgi:xanthine dehydrogenase large subunit
MVKAAQDAAHQIRERLADYAVKLYGSEAAFDTFFDNHVRWHLLS